MTGRALEKTIVANSVASDLRGAVTEWRLDSLPAPLTKYVSCECCGTAIKRTARISNDRRGTTLVIGLVCYDHLVKLLQKSDLTTGLVPREEFVRQSREQQSREHERQYLQYFPGVDLR